MIHQRIVVALVIGVELQSYILFLKYKELVTLGAAYLKIIGGQVVLMYTPDNIPPNIKKAVSCGNTPAVKESCALNGDGVSVKNR